MTSLDPEDPEGLNQSTGACFSVNRPPFRFNHTIASAYFPAVFSALGVGSNLIALAVLVKSFRRTRGRARSSFLLLLCGLVVTDLAGLLVTGSVVVSLRTTGLIWTHLDPHCHLCNFMGMSMIFYGLCPLLLGASMAVERFVGINRPFAHPARASPRRACGVVAGVWAAAGATSLLPLLGLGSYHVQVPGSWCFLNISAAPLDLAFCLVFSAMGLLSLGVSFVLNTVSVVTLIRVCCGRGAQQRRRDHEVEMMVQLILIMVIASVCWCPLLVFIAQSVLTASAPHVPSLLLCIRLATWNQILDPWVYILFRRAVLRRVYPRGSITSLYPSFSASTRPSLGGAGGHLGQAAGDRKPEDVGG